MHKYVLSFLLGGLLVAGVVFADHGQEAEIAAVAQAEQITTADLGIQNPGTLPTSPFYFFKEWRRGIQGLFTFNKVAKAELEAKFSNEKAAELKVVQEQRPDDERAIGRALSNFQRSQERLRVRLEKVQDSSQNPNIDKLLDKVVTKSVLHEKLLEEVQARNEGTETIRIATEVLKEQVMGVVQGLAVLDTSEKFALRIKNALENSPGSAFKDIRSVEFIDKVEEKLTEEAKVHLESVREEFKEKVKEKIEAESADGEKLKAILESIPGDEARRAVVLEEIRVKASDKAADVIGKVQERLEKKIVSDTASLQRRAANQMSRAEEMIRRTEEKIARVGEANPLYFVGGKFAEVFPAEEFQRQLSERFGVRAGIMESFPAQYRIPGYKGMEKERCQFVIEFLKTLDYIRGVGDCDVFEDLSLDKAQQTVSSKLLTVSETHLQKAREALEAQSYGEAFGQARSAEVAARNALRAFEGAEDSPAVLERMKVKIQERVNLPEPVRPVESPVEPIEVVCTQEYKPVCGVDGKTYSNRCSAEQQNRVRVAYEGECNATTAGEKKCGTYTQNGVSKEYCTVCGNGVCESQETCTPSVAGGSRDGGFFVTTDCGPLYCPQDCEARKIQE